MKRPSEELAQWRSKKARTPHIIVGCFLLLIAVGTLLLLLPFATAEGQHTSFLTALFTATTSVCVTGLVVVPTYIHWSLFGKIVILFLIQFGGFGMVSLASFLLSVFKRRYSLRFMMLVQENFNLDSMVGLPTFTKRVVKDVFIIEFIGALLCMVRFIPLYGVGRGIWYSVFHAISAFCNAGIDILGPDSLVPFRSDTYLLVVTMALIILGGLGFIVWFDLWDKAKTAAKRKYGPFLYFRRLGEHTKAVLGMTAFLTLLGAVLVYVLERFNPDTLMGMSRWDRVVNSLFQSVTWRTAGFASIAQENLTDATAVLGLLFMFIGGSPVGTAGGVKTITVLILFMNAVAFVRGRKNAVLHKRVISYMMIVKAAAVVAVSFMVTMIGIVLIIATNDLPAIGVLYEMFSATGTVGLSQGLTASLNAFGRVVIVFSMFLGRIGPITLVLFFEAGRSRKEGVAFAEGNFTVG